jgi:hypothetical protein
VLLPATFCAALDPSMTLFDLSCLLSSSNSLSQPNPTQPCHTPLLHRTLFPSFSFPSLQYFAQGMSRLLYSMAVIELAKPGQEATTFELVATVGNAALLVNSIVSTQLLAAFKGVACDSDDGDGDYDDGDDGDASCSSGTVDTSDKASFDASHGPWRFTQYTIALQAVSLAALCLFTQFLPKSKQQCRDWKVLGEALGTSELRGRAALCMVVATLLVLNVLIPSVSVSVSVSVYLQPVQVCFLSTKVLT